MTDSTPANPPHHRPEPVLTPDLQAERVSELKRLFPDLFNGEGKLDEQALRALCSPDGASFVRQFVFNWYGKQEAKELALKPSCATLLAEPERSVNFDTTENVIIEGDNLEVLKLLQATYAGQIKCIYIDPPYNTKKEFIYLDNFAEDKTEYWRKNGVVHDGVKLTALDESDGRKHSKWLNMMYPRLVLARQLLRDDGVIFISIDDNEVHHLRKICDEIFGAENLLSTLIWNKMHSQQQGMFKKYHEYVLAYAKLASTQENIAGGDGEIDAIALKKPSKGNPVSEFLFPAGVRIDSREEKTFPAEFGEAEKVVVTKGEFSVCNGRTQNEVGLSAGWTQKDQMEAYFNGEEVCDTRGQRIIEFYFSSTGKLKCRKDRSKITPPTLLREYGTVSQQTKDLDTLMGINGLFPMPKPVSMIADFISWFTDEGDIILDFFAGSGTAAHAAMQQNAEDGGKRRFILVQVPECSEKNDSAYKAGYKTISDICIDRVKKAGAQIAADKSTAALDTGFRVYRLAESNFPQNVFVHDPSRSDEEQAAAFETYLKDYQFMLFEEHNFDSIITEIALKYGYGFFSTHVKIDAFTENSVYTFSGNNIECMLCIDDNLAESTVKLLLTDYTDRQLILSRDALKSGDHWQLRREYKANLRLV